MHKMIISTTFLSHLLTCAFQINDYLKTTNLLYPSIEVESIVINIVDERLRLVVVKKSTSRITQ